MDDREEARRLHRALTARDARFDGLFFVGVTSTGIYCRPICPARTPKAANCRFFRTPQTAEQAGFRPCLRCRPELAPGSAPVDDSQRIARMILQRLEEEPHAEPARLDRIADQFELSSRQIRRIVRKELGVPPVQILLTRRLLLAKQLLTETDLPITRIAFASGFSSLRRFNDAFKTRYAMAPTRLRLRPARRAGTACDLGDTSTLQLMYRPPYDWRGLIGFLKARALDGVEWVTEDAYARTVELGAARGWMRVTPLRGHNALSLEFAHSLMPVLPALLARARALFDLDARPDLIGDHLAKDPRLARAVRATPGMRVPGAFSGFEVGVRAILGQQVSVRAATTIACRLVKTIGEAIATPFPQLNRLTPTADRIAPMRAEDIARLGVTAARSRSIVALARACIERRVMLDSGTLARPEDAVGALIGLPGIGPWTANYIAMRALSWPDAFPKEDMVIRCRLGSVSAARAEALSQPWRPWRSYAVMHLWRSASTASSTSNGTMVLESI